MAPEGTREGQLEEELILKDEQIKSLVGSEEAVGAMMAAGHGITHKQATILCILVHRAPAIVTRQSFHLLLYGNRADGGPEPKIFDIHISRIRKLLRRASCPGQIITVKLAGFKADPELVKWAQQIFDKENVR